MGRAPGRSPVSDEMLAPEALDAPTREAVKLLVLGLADSKRLMGIRYSDWICGAPAIEAGIAVSSMAQDEWGHARLLYAMLKGFDMDPVRIEHEREASDYASIDPLDEPFPDWAAVVAGVVVVDGALRAALEGFAHGRFEPARSRVPKMLAEEEFHTSLGAAWFRRLAASEEARPLLVGAAESALPACLAWLGASDETALALAEAGVMPPGSELVAAYREAIGGPLAEVGVSIDDLDVAGEWDPARRRGPGHPDEEAVQRARGDLNRALFVE